MSEILQGLIDTFTKAGEDAEKRRTLASANWELYKLEAAAGEKKAYAEAVKKVQASMKLFEKVMK